MSDFERITEVTPMKALNGLTPPVARTAKGNRRAPYRLGQWTEHLDPDTLEMCQYGYHYVTGADVLGWLGHDLYVAETCPDHPPVNGGNKHVTCRLKVVCPVPNWDGRTRRLFAADCAESVLLAERACGWEPDPRSWEAVSVARRYATADVSSSTIASARAAAWDVAGDAGSESANTTFYARWLAYVNGDPIPPVEPLYGEEKRS